MESSLTNGRQKSPPYHHQQQQQQPQQMHQPYMAEQQRFQMHQYRHPRNDFYENGVGGGRRNSSHSESSSSGCEDDLSTGAVDDIMPIVYSPDHRFNANMCNNNNNNHDGFVAVSSSSAAAAAAGASMATATSAMTNFNRLGQMPADADKFQQTLTMTPRRGCIYENGKIESHEMTHAHNNRFAATDSSKRRVSSLDRSRTHETDFCRSAANGGGVAVGSMTAKKHSKVPPPQQTHRYPSDIDVDCIENYSEQMDKCQSSPSTSTGSASATKSMTNGKEKMQKQQQQQQQTHHYRSRSNDTDSGHGSGITVNGTMNGTTSKHSSQSSQSKWARSNIAVTMEPYEPGSSGRHTEHVYQQIDDSPRSYYDCHTMSAGPSRPPPPNSIRALLMTANRNGGTYRMSPSLRHMYTTRYGTQENIYEEITSEERLRLLSGGHSMLSLHQPSTVEEEFRRVANRHRRILGELNLSVEAMLMPSTPPSDSPVDEVAGSDASSSNAAGAATDDLDAAVGPTDELLSPVSVHANNLAGDMDSGFGGSSSSGNASFLGSLRYRNGLTTRSSTPNGHCSSSISGSGSSCRSSQRSNEDPGILMISSRSSSLYGHGINGGTIVANGTLYNVGNRFRSAEDPGPSGSCIDTKTSVAKTSFWSRKGWRKFPGFSSNTNVNKTGINNGKFNSIFSCDV